MYKKMEKILKDGEIGDFKLEHFKINSNDFFAKLQNIEPGEYVKLTQNGEVVMSNTEMEKRTNTEFVKHAHGNVLIGGLGIGMIILAIQEKENVKSIIILEKNQEVINLVKNQLPLNEKVKIVNADVFTYEPLEEFDTIYMDIWNYINQDVYYNEMIPLMDYYSQYLVDDETTYLDCWCKYEAMYGIRI